MSCYYQGADKGRESKIGDVIPDRKELETICYGDQIPTKRATLQKVFEQVTNVELTESVVVEGAHQSLWLGDARGLAKRRRMELPSKALISLRNLDFILRLTGPAEGLLIGECRDSISHLERSLLLGGDDTGACGCYYHRREGRWKCSVEEKKPMGWRETL